jgi:Cep192 domain 4
MRASTSQRQVVIAALAALAALLLAVPATAAACGEESPPIITNPKVTPGTLPWEGGTIRIEVEVEVDYDCGVTVWEEITSSEGGYYPAEMAATEETVNEKRKTYRVEFGAPPNYQEWPVYYQVTISATDSEGASAESVFAGETEVAAAPQFDEAPYVSNATVTPRNLVTEGGWVTISADISDNRSVSYAFALVTLPDETQKEVPLEPVSSSHFVGHFKAPPNYGTSAQKYPVTVYGQDDIGQESSETAGNFSVAGRAGPLSIEIERGGSIGNVTVGRTAIRAITVHNSGSKWIKSSLTLAGSSWFVLRNAVGRIIEFSIGPDQSRRFWLEFTPTTTATATGSLTLARADGAQPPIVRSLSGRGIPPAS